MTTAVWWSVPQTVKFERLEDVISFLEELTTLVDKHTNLSESAKYAWVSAIDAATHVVWEVNNEGPCDQTHCSDLDCECEVECYRDHCPEDCVCVRKG